MRDLEALAREGLAKDMEHLNTADVRELVKVIHTTGEYDAVINEMTDIIATYEQETEYKKIRV